MVVGLVVGGSETGNSAMVKLSAILNVPSPFTSFRLNELPFWAPNLSVLMNSGDERTSCRDFE